MPGTEDIPAVVEIDVSHRVAIHPIPVVYGQSADSVHPSIPIVDLHTANLLHSPVRIVKDGYILYLNNCPVMVVLDKGIVIESGVKGNAHIAGMEPDVYPAVDVKIVFAVGVDGKGDTVLYENEGILKKVSQMERMRSVRLEGEKGSSSQHHK